MGEVTKSVVLPVELAAELEALASASERSFSGEVRDALKRHTASRRHEFTETPSGFCRADAEDLGVVFVNETPGAVMAEWRQDGAVVAFGTGPLVQVLSQVEAWVAHRASMGVVTSAGPVPVVAGVGAATENPHSPGPTAPPVAAGASVAA